MRFTYAYRSGPVDQADNRALRAAYELQTPLVYFRALAPGQYLVVAPMFVTADDPAARVVVLEPGLPVQDMKAGGLVSGADVRAYATRESTAPAAPAALQARCHARLPPPLRDLHAARA